MTENLFRLLPPFFKIIQNLSQTKKYRDQQPKAFNKIKLFRKSYVPIFFGLKNIVYGY
ncbi:hypothetical protein MCERE19_00601 [Spirosomataceae bacterium]|jgi:hypothetical protein